MFSAKIQSLILKNPNSSVTEGFCVKDLMRNLLPLALGFLLSTSAPPPAQAQQEVVVSVAADGTSSADTPAKARAESLKDALNRGCLQVIGNLIGESRLEKNMPVIKSKILSQTQKFIQFYKASEPATKNGETATSVSMKISVTSLKDMLSQEGILNQSEGPVAILPVIRFAIKKDTELDYRWWTEELNATNAFLRDQERAAFKPFETMFRAKNFYFIDPVTAHYVQWMPQPYRVDAPAIDDLLWMGEFFKAQMIISGDAVVQPGSTPGSVKLSVKIVAYHTANGRVVGEVTRTFETAASDFDLAVQQVVRKSFADVAKDLTSQVFEEWTRGTLGATLLRIGISGGFNAQDLENFKKQIISKIGDVKSIRERRLEKGMATFEVDSSAGLPGLVKTLEQTSFDGFKVNVSKVENSEVDLRWSKVGSN